MAIVLREAWLKEREKFLWKGHPYFKWFDEENRKYRRKSRWINEQKVTSPYALFFAYVDKLRPRYKPTEESRKHQSEAAKRIGQTEKRKKQLSEIAKANWKKNRERLVQVAKQRALDNREVYVINGRNGNRRRWEKERANGFISNEERRTTIDLIFGNVCFICSARIEETGKNHDLHHLYYVEDSVRPNDKRKGGDHNLRLKEAFEHPERFVRLCHICHRFVTTIQKRGEVKGVINRLEYVLSFKPDQKIVPINPIFSLVNLEDEILMEMLNRHVKWREARSASLW